MLSSSGPDAVRPTDVGIRYIGLPVPDGARSMVEMLGPDLWSIEGSAYLILPSDRLVREVVRSRVSGATDRAMTVKRLAGYLYDLYGGSDAVRDDLFREAAVARIMDDPSIVRLRPVGGRTRGMARHVSEAIKEMLINGRDPKALTSIASNGRSKEFAKVYSRYVELLRSMGSVDIEMLPTIIVNSILRDPSRVSGSFFGIYMPGKLDRSYSSMLSSLLKAGRGAIVMEHEIRGPPDFIGPGFPRAEPRVIPPGGSRARETVTWPEQVPVIYGDDRITSIRAVCRHIKHLVLERGVDPREIAIVTPGGSLHERYLPTILSEFGIRYSMDREIRVTEVPAVSGLIGLLSLPSSEWRSMDLAEHLTAISGSISLEGGPGVTGPELAIVFTEVPIFGGSDTDEGWTLPMGRYMDEKRGSERVRSICGKAIPVLRTLLGWIHALSALRTDSRRFALEVRSFIDLVQRSISDPVMKDLRDEALKKLDHAVAKVPAVDPNPGADIDLASFMDMLSLCLGDVKVALTEDNEGVWVGKIKQQAGRRTKVLILHSMADGEFPQRSPDFRLLTGEERAALALRERPDRREALEDMAVCLTSGDGPIISLHRMEGDRPVAISTMLEGLALKEIDVGKDPRSRMEVLRLGACADEEISVQGSGKLRMIDTAKMLRSLPGGDQTWDRIAERRRSFGGEDSAFQGRVTDPDLVSGLAGRFGPDHVWSASRLETYRECPYAFFIRYVLGLEPMERLDPEVPPDRKGIIIHRILEGFFARLSMRGKSRVLKGEVEESYAVMAASARDVISSYPYHGPFWEAITDLLLGDGGEKGLLREFVEAEAGYDGPFHVEGTEVAFGRGGSPAMVHGSEGSILMEGIIDRIDSAGPIRMIWDYKTGVAARDKGKDSLQVPLYLASLMSIHPDWKPGGGGYYLVGKRGGVERSLVLGDDREPEPSLKEVADSIVEKIDEAHELINSARSGIFTPSGPCPNRSYCRFSDICRRDEG